MKHLSGKLRAIEPAFCGGKLVGDPDFFRAAKHVVDWHGKDALAYATLRADRYLDDGDLAGSAVWRWISYAIEELHRERQDDEAMN